MGRSALQGKTVIELGSGTGLVGLVAGFLGAQVRITDQRSAVILFRDNKYDKVHSFDLSVLVRFFSFNAGPF
jgi:predicted nicotinamide N-methyase